MFQVLSETVSKALPLVVGKEATETARFVDIFDKFFGHFECQRLHIRSKVPKAFFTPILDS